MILAGISVASFAVGVVMSYAADTRQRHCAAMETAAGVLLIAGFALLGYLIQSRLCVP